MIVCKERDNLEELPSRQRRWVVAFSLGILYLTVDLARKRKFRDEDSWLWLLAGFFIFLFGTNYRLLKKFGSFLGIVTPTSTTFFFGQFFLMLLAIQRSVRDAFYGEAIKNLAQNQALLEAELKMQMRAR